MDMQGVLSLQLNCLRWGLLIGHIISDITLIGAVSVLSGHEDHCCCESLGGVAWFPTCPMRFVLYWWAACCYLGDCSAPIKIRTTHSLTCLQGSLEEIAINIQHLLQISRLSAATWILLPVIYTSKILAEKFMPAVPEVISWGRCKTTKRSRALINLVLSIIISI